MVLQGVTWGYGGLQGDTVEYKGLQEIRRGYGGLKGIAWVFKKKIELESLLWGYRGIHWITRDYKRLQGITLVFKKKIVLKSSLDNLSHIVARDPNPESRNTLSTVSLYFELVFRL